SEFQSLSAGEAPANGGELGLRLWRRFGHYQIAAASFGLNFRLRGRAKGMSAHAELLGQVAITEDLNPIGAAIRQSNASQCRFINHGTVIEPVQCLQVNRQVMRAVTRIVESTLRDAADQRHLAALESDPDRTAGPGRLAFAAPAAGLAV